MRFSIVLAILCLFGASTYAQVIKEINYTYEKAGQVKTSSTRKNVFVYGSDNNKVQVVDLKKDSGSASFDTTSKYTVVYDTAKKQIVQTYLKKAGKGGWKKEGEVITLFNKDKNYSEIQWKAVKKDKVVPHSRFVYTYDSLKRVKEIVYEMADSTGKYKPESKFGYEYYRKGIKSIAMSNMQDNKWIRLSVYTVMFDSSNVTAALIKFKNGQRLDNQYYVNNSMNIEKQQRTLIFKNYQSGTSKGKAEDESFVTVSYKDDAVSSVTAYVKVGAAEKKSWTKTITAKYTYDKAPAGLNPFLKNYFNYDAMGSRFNDFVAENYLTDSNGLLEGSKFSSTKGENKGVLYSADGGMLKYFAQ